LKLSSEKLVSSLCFSKYNLCRYAAEVYGSEMTDLLRGGALVGQSRRGVYSC
jgi:hypothetical protein